jgi:hypothetical protein
MFDGARADLTKSLSMNPAFQVTHSFILGSQVSAPSYNFGAVFANNDVSQLILLAFVAVFDSFPTDVPSRQR